MVSGGVGIHYPHPLSEITKSKPGSWLELYLGLSRRKDRVLLGFKLLKFHLCIKIKEKEDDNHITLQSSGYTCMSILLKMNILFSSFWDFLNVACLLSVIYWLRSWEFCPRHNFHKLKKNIIVKNLTSSSILRLLINLL